MSQTGDVARTRRPPFQENEMTQTTLLALATAALFAAGSAGAQSISVRAGVANFNPKSDNGRIAGATASIDNSSRVVVGASYHLDDTWEFAVDTAATTFKHTVALSGLGNVVRLKHHPVNIGVNWHFLGGDSDVSPYVGLGWNWTSLSDATGIGALRGVPVRIDDSNGVTATLGADLAIDERFFVRGEARYINFDSTVFAGGANAGTANVDPWQYSLLAGLRF